jgi:hypothetical protein
LWGDFPNRSKPSDPRDEGERRRNLDDTMTPSISREGATFVYIEEETAIA